jgi:hypothetical protein
MPASRAIAFSDGSFSATIGAMSAPSLCPMTASRDASTSGRVRRYASPARTSSAKSALVAPRKVPPDAPVPRSSMRSTPIPRRPSESAN